MTTETNSLTVSQEKDLIERIGGTYKDKFERAHSYFVFLKTLPEALQYQAFEVMLTKTDHPDTKNSGKRYNVAGLSEVDKENFSIGLGQLVDGHFQYMLSVRPSANELAKHMWTLINGFKTDQEKIFGIGWLIADKVVPYVQIPSGGVKMSDDTFKAMLDQLRPKIRMIDAILRWPSLQRTEQMSLCLSVLMDGTTVEEQAVLMARIVARKEEEALRVRIQSLGQ